jgi:hypothetical protein
MGIIISSFIGCGREYFKNIYGKKVKIFDTVEEIPLTSVDGTTNQDLLEECYNKVMSVVDKYDIVFIPSSKGVRSIFNEHNVDYDIFYPSSERRGEFIENQVIKRTNPKIIRELDKNFEEWVDDIDNDESQNCYKHKLSNKGEYIGNNPQIMSYINSLNNE